MDQGLKERLIGAAVLVALGVWLIPWLLDGRQEQVELASSSSSAVRLPAPDGPLPVRSQTLSLDAAKSDVLASESHPDAAAPTTAPPAVAETSAAVAESAAPGAAPAPAQESVPAPKPATASKPAADHSTAPRVATATAPPPASKPVPKPAAQAPAATAQAAPAHGDWAVQLGSFGAEDNAKKLAQKVNVYGYKPEVASSRTSGKALYRVRVGPYKSRAEADATASALSAHGFSPQVVAAD
jgi:DedD protein